jgi:hypothetical protein
VQVGVGAQLFHTLYMVVNIGHLKFRLNLNGHHLSAIFKISVHLGVYTMLLVVYLPVAAHRVKIQLNPSEFFRQAGNKRVFGIFAKLVAQIADYPLNLFQALLGLPDGGFGFRMGLLLDILEFLQAPLGLLDNVFGFRMGLLKLRKARPHIV